MQNYQCLRSGTGYGRRRHPILLVRQSAAMPSKESAAKHACDESGLDHSRPAPTRGERPGIVPAASPFAPDLSGGALVLGLVALVTILAGRGPERDTRAPAEAALPMPVPTGANYQADAEIVSFLAMLQTRGRLVDFLMDDINTYDDAQVGAAARVVHAGCKAALLEHFRISPVRAESEGTTVQVAAGYLADEYRLVGKISSPAPFSGVLVHHGWKTDAVNLPRVLRSSTNRLPTIAPAEVEVK